jgi:AraC-like DNA-binding protein
MRLLHALDRLEEARGALTDLALELGFSSQSHFTDAFRGAFGLPPGAVGRAGLEQAARASRSTSSTLAATTRSRTSG